MKYLLIFFIYLYLVCPCFACEPLFKQDAQTVTLNSGFGHQWPESPFIFDLGELTYLSTLSKTDMIRYLHHHYKIEFIIKGNHAHQTEMQKRLLTFLSHKKFKEIANAHHFYLENNLLGQEQGLYLAPYHISVTENKVFFFNQRPLGDKAIIILDEEFRKSVLLHEFIHHLIQLQRIQGDSYHPNQIEYIMTHKIISYVQLQEQLEKSEINTSGYTELSAQIDLLDEELTMSKNLEEILVNRILLEHKDKLNLEQSDLEILLKIHESNLKKFLILAAQKKGELNEKYTSLDREDYALALTHRYEINQAILMNEVLRYAQISGQTDKLTK